MLKTTRLHIINDKYKCLGTTINENNDSFKEIRIRIERARSIFIKMKRLFCSRDLNLELKRRMMRCYVLSELYYRMEAWTLRKADVRRLEAFELWRYRRMPGISWVERVTKVEVVRRMRKDEVILTIKRRKILYMGHIMRGEKYQILQNIMQGKL